MEQPILGIAFTLAAYVVGSVVFFKFSRKRGFSSRETRWILAAGLCGGILGAKFSRMLISLSAGATPESIFAHPDGRTIIGGILFGWMAVEFAKAKLKVNRSTGDAFALALSVGEAIGRIGCFFNGCCYGSTSTIFCAVYQAGAWRHPAQLYSAAVALGIFLLLCYLRTRVTFEGDLFRIYLLCFGIARFFLEFVRERTSIHFGLSIAQWVSLEIAGSMLIAMLWVHRSQKQIEGAVKANEQRTL